MKGASFLEIKKEGSKIKIKTFEGDFKLPISKEVKVSRVSHIVPQNIYLRYAFLVLRAAFGDKGIIANWTRHWNTLWVVKFRWQKQWFGPFKERGEAIFFERRRLLKIEMKFNRNIKIENKG